MNPLKTLFNKIKTKYHNSKFFKTSNSMEKGQYKTELERLERDLTVIGDLDIVDDMVIGEGFESVARSYRDFHSYYKDYYSFIIKEILKDPYTSTTLKAYARKVQIDYDKTMQKVIKHLADSKRKFMFGESLQEEVKTFKGNAWSDEPLPRNRKEEISEEEEDFTEGLKGFSIGAAAGAVLAMTLNSLAVAFHLHPKVITGISAGLGAMLGHFIQKHYFIDLTNYVKLKRYVMYHPEAYDIILDMLQRNAEKFRQKDPTKYKKILENLARLQKNPPAQLRTLLDDEIEREEAEEDDPYMFDVRDNQGNVVKRGTSQLDFSNSRGSRSSSYSRRDRFTSRKDYDTRDLGASEAEVNAALDSLIGET